MGRFADQLRQERNSRRVSQQWLALETGISPRHLSFLETGRANPSRATVARLAEALELPLRARSALHESAGFASPHTAQAVDAPAMAAVSDALGHMMESQIPYPALVMTTGWRLERANPSYMRLLALAGLEPAPGDDLLFQLLTAPSLRELIENWPAIAAHSVRRALRDASSPSRRREIEQWAEAASPGLLHGPAGGTVEDVPVMTMRMKAGEGQIAWVSIVATFGAPNDVTAEELLIEFFHPADEATRHFARTYLVPG